MSKLIETIIHIEGEDIPIEKIVSLTPIEQKNSYRYSFNVILENSKYWFVEIIYGENQLPTLKEKRQKILDAMRAYWNAKL